MVDAVARGLGRIGKREKMARSEKGVGGWVFTTESKQSCQRERSATLEWDSQTAL